MAIRPVFRKAVRSQIDWALVGVAGAMAVVLVLSTTLMAWVASRSVNSVGRASRLGLGQSSTSATQSVGNERFGDDAERGNERPVQRGAFANYPEGDQQADAREAASGSAVEQNGQKQLARQTSSAPDSRCQAGACERGANEMRSQVAFAQDATEAAGLAKKEHKLMLVLHVSGNFEESKFT